MSASPAPVARTPIAWLAAGGAIAVAIVVLVIIVGLGSSSIVARWAPASTVAYAEARLDLPGDQQAQLESFLAAFPILDGSARLPDRFAELRDRMLQSRRERLPDGLGIEEWFGGQIAVAGVGSGASTSDAATAGGVLIAAVTNESAARASVERLVPGQGLVEQHGNTTITSLLDGRVAWAITGGVLLAGDARTVKAALDTQGSSSFTSSTPVSTARRELGRNEIVFWYADGSAAKARLEASGEVAPSPIPGLDQAVAAIPAWVAGGLRFQDQSAVAEVVVPHVDGRLGTNATSTLTTRVPGTAIVFAQGHEVGPRLASMVDQAGSDGLPAELGGALRLLGGASGLVGWISELGVVITPVDGAATTGLLATSTDPDKAAGLFDQLEIAVRLTGADITTTEWNGTKIVSFDTGDLGGLLAPGGAGGLLPEGTPIPADASLRVSWAVVDGVVILGPSPAFVQTILATTRDTSLAANDAFERAVGVSGDKGVGLAWASTDQAIGLIGSIHPDSAVATALIARALAPFDGALATVSAGGDVDRATVVVTVSGTDR